ncbi:MAG: hypothetical protein KDH96_11210, partial [Candidatus Riesia sp.]|nr:hypothetical protein [Candidatus Riesia sp.]
GGSAQIEFSLTDATTTHIKEFSKDKKIEYVQIYTLTGQLVYEGQDIRYKTPENGLYISRTYYTDGTFENIKFYSKSQTKIPSLPNHKSVKENNWIWFSGDSLRITGNAIPWLPYIIEDNPTSSETYIFYFLPSISGIVQGNVTYENTTIGMQNVNVKLVNTMAPICSTDTNGFYQISWSPGTYDLYLEKDGYVEYINNFSIELNSVTTINVELQSDSTYPVDGYISDEYGYREGLSVTYDGYILNPEITDENGYFNLQNIPYSNRHFYVYNQIDTLFSDIINIESDTTLNIELVYDDPCDNIDSILYYDQWYHTIEIGNQCWFKENLNIGEIIPSTTPQTNNGTVEKYCLFDDSTNCDLTGGLYRWDEMMSYSTIPSSQGICPDGWHIPSDSDWITLQWFVDPLTGSDNVGFHLKSNEFGGIDTFGMSIKGCGSTNNGGWYSTVFGDYWTSDEVNINDAKLRFFITTSNYIIVDELSKLEAKGIRCIKD